MKKRKWFGPMVMLVVVVGILGVLRSRFGGVAETPASFAAHTTLDAALTESAESGKPVLALVTADWCAPCQSLKRGALADPRVTDWIGAHVVPAYVDGTDAELEQTQHDLRLLRIEVFPTLVLLDSQGVEVSRRTGALSAGKLLTWLEGSGG